MKIILVFKNGELIKQIPYKTKALAKKNYFHFLKYGMLELNGNLIENIIFELL